MAAHETDHDIMSQTRVLKVSRHVICLANCKECHPNEISRLWRRRGKKEQSSRDSVPSRIEGQPMQSPLNSTRRSASSAGILMYRRVGSKLEVLLVHPGGPYWSRKDHGAWSIPKGEMNAGEDAGIAAIREFLEETGVALTGPLEPLGEIRQRAGKRVLGFAVEGDLDVHSIKSNTFEIEWPPRSGKMQAFPEIDRAEWFDLPGAHAKILEGQRPFLDRLAEHWANRG
jgi:predicted NUDIX family NTP pyrophosphohydrolase